MAKSYRDDTRLLQMGKRLYTVEEAATYLGRTTWSMRHLISMGQLPIVRHGRRVFLDRSDLDSYVENNKVSYG